MRSDAKDLNYIVQSVDHDHVVDLSQQLDDSIQHRLIESMDASIIVPMEAPPVFLKPTETDGNNVQLPQLHFGVCAQMRSNSGRGAGTGNLRYANDELYDLRNVPLACIISSKQFKTCKLSANKYGKVCG